MKVHLGSPLKPQRIRILLICVLINLGSCSTHAPATNVDPETAITEFNQLYLTTINEGDIEALADLTTEDHMMIASGGEPVVGKQALVNAMTKAFERFDIEESWTPQQTAISGELAWQRGTFVVIATPKAGGDSLRVSGTFMRTYQRQANGRWMMVIDTHASD